MASPVPPVNPDSLIAIKVNHLGVTKRVKLPLRDLAAPFLEDKLRSILGITSSSGYRFERYSDSAGVFVLLDRNNPSVYRQLYRAAKAKQKLKLRVAANVPIPPTDVPAPDQTQRSFESAATPAKEAQPVSVVPYESQSPRPVTLEDALEPTPAESAQFAADQQTAAPPAIQPLSFTGYSATVASTASIPVSSDVSSPIVVSSDMSGPDHPAVPGCYPTPAAAAAAVGAAAAASSSTTGTTEDALQASIEGVSQSHGELERAIARLAVSVAKLSCKAFSGNDDAVPTPSVALGDIYREAYAAKADATPAGLSVTADTSASAHLAPVADVIHSIGFSIRCNSCDCKIDNTHYHCSTCEAGDFDLCKKCVDLGISCYNHEHWLISRSIKNGMLVNSTTERISSKPKANAPTPEPVHEDTTQYDTARRHDCATVQRSRWTSPVASISTRTCNNCITELPEASFLHCKVCPDFDLCKDCFRNDKHGHHPAHEFAPAVNDTQFDAYITRRLAAGRGEVHNAICDGCNKFITGVRHKCLDCPDWDYCSACVLNANVTHRLHRFIKLSEPMPFHMGEVPVVHTGIYCDGPLCANKYSRTIEGVRYKCAICDDTDFCASCEANPANKHNETHPLIKFRTPVRHVGVTTIHGEKGASNMLVLGDRGFSRPTEVRTVVDTKPTVHKEEKPVAKVEPAAAAANKTPAEPDAAQLGATFQSEAVSDGTILPPNHVFEQTWVLRNTGSVAWPAGCCVRFVSGDYMGHVDRNHPAGIGELVSASESTICYEPLAPGSEFSFTVLLRTPPRFGKTISYWRLSTKGGIKFGDRLWCQVNVRPKEETKDNSIAEVEDKGKATEASVSADEVESAQASQMIFPKLEKESPMASVHEPEASGDRVEQDRASQTSQVSDQGTHEFDDDEWDEDSFLTDEEYDVLDASDEEYLGEQLTKDQKK